MITKRMSFQLLVLFSALASAGCHQVEIHFNAYQSSQKAFPAPSPANTVAIVVGSEQDEPLLQEEVGGKIEYLLRENGFRVAPKEDAAYVLSCWFGMDSGKTYTGIMPIYEPGEYVSTRVRSSRGNWKTVTHYLPGYTQYVPYSYTVFCKYLSLTLHENTATPATEEEKEPPADQDKLDDTSIIWRCTCVNADESTDLRWRTNHMLVVAFDHLGIDTPRQKKIKLSEEDKRVKELLSQRINPASLP
jgi:hypothetical protein